MEDRMTENTETALAQMAPLQQALALATEAGDIEALRDVRAMASALQRGAKARGMGIQSENEAAEVVLRSERAMGLTLARMKAEGVRRGPGGDYVSGGSTPSRYGATLAELLGMGEKVANARASDWQKLAAMPEDQFEGLLRSAREAAERIAKWDFYRAARPAVVDPVKHAPGEAREDEGFVKFRAGVHQLLGWEVGENGVGAATKNGLIGLPLDQLTELKLLVEALASAFGAAVKARRS